MSVRGGSGSKGLTLARAMAVFALVLLLAPSLPISGAQSPADPWWGPSDRANPTTGWAIRVPVVVENQRAYTMKDLVVAVDIDFGKLLVDAGWTNRTAGTETTVRGFTLDIDSIRVVEYGPGFSPGPIQGGATKPVPHTFYKAPFEASHHRDFDESRNPSGTVLFFAKGPLAPAARRFFYVYANPLEFGKTQADPGPLADRAPLDAFLWGSHGTTAYGFIPQQDGQTQRLQVKPMQAAAKWHVELYTYSLGRFNLYPPTPTQKNPQDLTGTSPIEVALPANTPFKIVADIPFVVEAIGMLTDSTGRTEMQTETFGWVPATNGSYAGTQFSMYGARALGSATVVKATQGGTVTVNVFDEDGRSYPAISLTSANPVRGIQVTPGKWNTIFTTGGNILVSLSPLTNPIGAYPYYGVSTPAVTGGPAGNNFFTSIPNDAGYLRVCPKGDVNLRVVDPARPSISVMPEGPLEVTSPLAISAPGIGCQVLNATGATPDSLLELYSVTGTAGSPPAAFTLDTGAWERRNPNPNGVSNSPASLEATRQQIGFFAGVGAVDFTTYGPVGMFGYYNDTRVSVQIEKFIAGKGKVLVNLTSFALPQDGYQVIQPQTIADSTGYLHLTSNKPIAVTSVMPFNYHYQVVVPGRPEQPHVTTGAGEFRGPLVDIRSREKDGRQDFRSTGPGSPITFPLEVANLGHWIAGESLTDTITLSCTGPQGWAVDGCSRDITLGSGLAERVDVKITPPVDSLNVNGTFIVEARSKSGVTSTFKLIVFVEIRYGVGMWFDVENGRKSIDPPVGLDPGETYRYNIVIKNTGSARDTFDITLEDPREGWAQDLSLDGELVESIELDGGETETLTFTVTAPNNERAAPNLVLISAQSRSSSLAADVLNSATRIRPKVDVRLTVEPQTRVTEPNATATFNLTVKNSGNNIFQIYLVPDANSLPKGWNSSLSIDDIYLGPGDAFGLSLNITPPLGARAGDLGTVKILAEVNTGGEGARIAGDQISAVVVVRKVHNVTTPNLLDAQALPGESFEYTLPLVNHGNGNDVVELLPGAVTPVWKMVAKTQSLHIDVDQTEDFPLTITVPEGTPPGPYNLTFTLRLTREATQNVTIPVNVLASARVEVRGIGALTLLPGQTRTVNAQAVNVGNVEGTFTFTDDAPPGWNVTFAPERAKLAPGERIPVTVSFNASREAPDGEYTLELGTLFDNATSGKVSVAANLGRPELFISSVEATGSSAPGDLVLVSATVGNRGRVAAENVSVALVVAGVSVDRVVISRIQENDAKVATLNWLATQRTSDIKVVLDPDGEIAELNRDNHEADVAFSSKLPIPATPLVGVALAIGIALILGRRNR